MIPVAFAGYRLCIAAVDGSSIALMSNSALRDEKPNWSRALNKIAFHRTSDYAGVPEGIVVADPDGTNVHLVIASGNEPAWSPDGSRLSYTVTYTDAGNIPHSEIHVVGADGNNPHLVNARWSFESSWSPARVP